MRAGRVSLASKLQTAAPTLSMHTVGLCTWPQPAMRMSESRDAYQQESASCGLFRNPRTAPVMPAKNP